MSSDPVESLSLNQSHELGLAEFSNEATAVTQINENVSQPMMVLSDPQYQDIKEYFARPRLVVKYNAATTRSNIASVDVTNFITQFWPAAAVNRLNGVYAYRATARFTLTLAATPFQQGLVSMGFQYASSNAGFTLNRGNFPALATNVPHVRMNFNDTTIAELDVPFIYPYDYIELANATAGGGDGFVYPYGNLSIVQQLPYVVLPGSTAPRLSLYISLVDMELFGAVPVALSAVIPQSGLAQMNKEAKRTKIASRTLSTVSKVSGVVGRVAGAIGVPFVPAISGTVSWLSEKLAGTAKAFGYSKPILEGDPIRVDFTVSGTSTNVDNADTAVVVSPYCSNKLDVSPVDGSTIDQMSMKYVLSQWNQCFVGTMSTSNSDGTFLYAARCCPTNFWFRTNAGTPGGNLPLPASSTLTTNCIAPTGLCYFGSMFRYFRGGLKFRFTFSKTKFHAGRVVATFVPSIDDSGSALVGTSLVPLPEVNAGGIQPFTSSAIFDLRDDNVFEFKVPYVSNRPFISTFGSFGGVSLGVIDVLRTTGETASSINFMVEVCGDEDFEFANFVGSGFVPTVDSAINSRVIQLQSGLSEQTPTPDDIVTLHDSTVEVCQHTVGEKVLSLKELLMVPGYTAASLNAGSSWGIELPVWGLYQPLPAITPPYAVNASIPFCNHHCNLIASCYAFLSGGTTHHVFFDSAENTVFVRQEPTDGNQAPSTISDPRYRGVVSVPRHYTSGSTVTALHFKTPSYQKTPLVPRDQFGFWSGSSTNPFVLSPGNNTIRISNFLNSVFQMQVKNRKATGANPTVVQYGYNGADDAKCHHYIGPPFVLLTASTSSAQLAEQPGSLL
jgi:hypothetical protein